MLDEEMDDIIRDAAGQHHPPYNDKAWDKMELILDKHLPLQKNRKRFIFYLLLLLLVGGGAFFAGTYFSKNKNTAIGEKQLNDDEKKIAINDRQATVSKEDIAKENATKQNIAGAENTEVNKTGVDKKDLQDGLAVNKPFRTKTKTVATIIAPVAPEDPTNKQELIIKGKPVQDITADLAKDENDIVVTNIPSGDKAKEISSKAPVTTETEKYKKEEIALDKAIAKTENKNQSSPENRKKKPAVPGKLGITFSAGPDVSFIKINKLGNTTLNYGAGLSYSFAKHFTVLTGFYVSKKIYAADTANYKPSTGLGPYSAYLKKIDANCKVYEIPVSVQYSFGQAKNHQWFGGLGLSSYLMKKEKYDYTYKYPNGMAYYKEYVLNNENKHYFSVLTLSGGYQYHISNRVSIAAAPYLKLPLGGVGYGKVKLNSAGVLFTATVKPFTKKK